MKALVDKFQYGGGFYYVATLNNLVSYHVILLNHFFWPQDASACCNVSLLSDQIQNKSLCTSFYLLRKQLCVFLHWAIYHIKHVLLCVFVQFMAEQPSVSQQSWALLLSSPPHPLFMLSSHLISFLLCPSFQAGSSWIDIRCPLRGGGRYRDSRGRRNERGRRMKVVGGVYRLLIQTEKVKRDRSEWPEKRERRWVGNRKKNTDGGKIVRQTGGE